MKKKISNLSLLDFMSLIPGDVLSVVKKSGSSNAETLTVQMKSIMDKGITKILVEYSKERCQNFIHFYEGNLIYEENTTHSFCDFANGDELIVERKVKEGRDSILSELSFNGFKQVGKDFLGYKILINGENEIVITYAGASKITRTPLDCERGEIDTLLPMPVNFNVE